jgi:hypothetical protein
MTETPTSLSAHQLTDQEWRNLVETEFRLRPAEGAEAQEWRVWWEAVADVLMAQAREDVRSSDLLVVLSGFAKYLASGKIPEPIKRVGKGRPGIGPTEERQIRIAVTYHNAVTKKLIAGLVDPHPSKTIKEAYGLRDERVVQVWVEQYKPLPLKKDLRERMEMAGATYKIANSRTQDAIRERAKRGERK